MNLKNPTRQSESKTLNDFLNNEDIKIKDIKYDFNISSWNKRGTEIGRHAIMILFEDDDKDKKKKSKKDDD